MTTNHIVRIILPIFLLVGCSSASMVDYRDPNAPIKDRIEDLIGKMTLEEKILQVSQFFVGSNTNVNNEGKVDNNLPAGVGSYIYYSENAELRNALQRQAVERTRLGIPILFGFDVIHGYRTIYPIPLAQACSWDEALVEQACHVAASETRRGGIDWTFAPMIDVARDGRWGRVAEGYGEDSYTNACFAAASVRGFQCSGDLKGPESVAACLKHYVGYGMSEGGRDYVATDFSPVALENVYLPPYEAGVKAGAASVMSAFNDISGVPASANPYTLSTILKGRLGFDGFVVSDWNSVEQLITQGVASDRSEAARLAFNAGVDMDMVDACYLDNLAGMISEGKVSQKRLDDAVRRILKVKFELGLFENPYTEVVPQEQRILLPEHVAVAEKLAEESIVLLKNNGALPLKNPCRLAVIGPLAKSPKSMLGSWCAFGREEDAESIWDGLEKEFGANCLSYAKGCDFDAQDINGFHSALRVAPCNDAIILCLGESAFWSGENASRSTLALPKCQVELAKKMAWIANSCSCPLILVLSNGRPLDISELEPLADAIVEIWQPGIAGGTPLAGVLSGRINPSGKLAITFPRSTGQVPIYYNMRQSSRPDQGLYQDIESTPLYPFGHGLSYTEYEYGDLRISSGNPSLDSEFTVQVDVKNVGNMAGYETVHWFIQDPYCSISRPVKELKHFERQYIGPGEIVTFSFRVNPARDLSYRDAKGEPILETGEYRIIVKDKVLTLSF